MYIDDAPHPRQQHAPARSTGTLQMNPLQRLPIATQLTLGFLIAALVAAIGAGAQGFLRSQALTHQSDFYRDFAQVSQNLNIGANYLEVMNSGLQVTLSDATATTPSQETLSQDKANLLNDAGLFDGIFSQDVQPEIQTLYGNAAITTLVSASDLTNSGDDQATFASGINRSWQLYKTTLNEVLTGALSGDASQITLAAGLEHNQAEALNTDLVSGIRSLERVHVELSTLVRQNSLSQEQQQSTISVIIALIAFIIIILVGWLFSRGIVRRLGQLRRVTQAVEEGRVDTRVRVVGADELAAVSVSVNGMLDTIVGLLQETRNQRDALTNAADRLFADMRIAGAGDLRVSASVSNDPIGLLGNAFNLTVGRFRRFILRVQTTIEQLEVISRREAKRTQLVFNSLQQSRNSSTSPGATPLPMANDFAGESRNLTQFFSVQMNRANELVAYIAQEGASAHLRAVLELAEEAYLSVNRMNQLVTSLPEARNSSTVAHLAQLQSQELSVLEDRLRQLGLEAFNTQKNANTGLRELNATLDQLAAATRGGDLNRFSGAVGVNNQIAGGDAAQIAGSYAQEIAEMASELMIIVQELRTGLSPFRIEGNIEAGNPGNAYGGNIYAGPWN